MPLPEEIELYRDRKWRRDPEVRIEDVYSAERFVEEVGFCSALTDSRIGREWYIGAMTDWTPRELEVDLSFLPEGNFQMAAYEDGANAEHMASDYKLVRSQVNKSSKLKIKLAPGGGWAARIVP